MTSIVKTVVRERGVLRVMHVTEFCDDEVSNTYYAVEVEGEGAVKSFSHLPHAETYMDMLFASMV